jgi:hypothetical protein
VTKVVGVFVRVFVRRFKRSITRLTCAFHDQLEQRAAACAACRYAQVEAVCPGVQMRANALPFSGTGRGQTQGAGAAG